ncbi:MAG: phage Gp37/Gp68 family protein [archaeon]|nr:phage Gp37/Gp68 family protein [archaeon]
MFAGDSSRGLDSSNVVRRSSTQFDLPLKKDNRGRYVLRDRIVLTPLTSDFFIEEADEWRDEAWSIIRRRKDISFILMTKRPSRILDNLPSDWGEGWDNVRLSVSVEDQSSWDERVDLLMGLPAKHRDVFIAPLVGPIDTSELLSRNLVECIYVGGEICNNARVCDMAWVEDVHRSCVSNGVSFFWRNCGTNLVVNGLLYHFDSMKDQGRFMAKHPMDHLVTDPMPRRKQKSLLDYE